jgi:DNA-binding MarR family transcriptional regulator
MGIRAVLERLDDQGPQTVPQIAAWLDVSRQAVQRVVDDAHALGYVDVRVNPTHRRSHLIALTPGGRDAFQRLHADELATLEMVAAEIDRTDLLTCARVLEHLVDALAARNRARARTQEWSFSAALDLLSVPVEAQRGRSMPSTAAENDRDRRQHRASVGRLSDRRTIP